MLKKYFEKISGVKNAFFLSLSTSPVTTHLKTLDLRPAAREATVAPPLVSSFFSYVSSFPPSVSSSMCDECSSSYSGSDLSAMVGWFLAVSSRRLSSHSLASVSANVSM